MNPSHHHPDSIFPSSPLHVAIIMDGNGRWAKARGLPRSEGHRAGRAAVRRAVLAALEQRIRMLTLFTFSSDNWERPRGEVAELMRTLEDFFREDATALAAQGARVAAIGRRNRLPQSLREAIENAESLGASVPPIGTDGDGSRPGGQPDGAEPRLHVRFAIDYSGRDSILEAARRFQQVRDASAETFARLFAEPGERDPAPDIDFLIRTGGEQRLSNCPLWEIAYTELYFTPCLWPDFTAADLDAALQDFYTRERRFGRIPAACA